MTASHALFEISWEVCNKLGGIHTVLSSKARIAVERLGDDYLTVGPWLLSDTNRELPFDDDPSMVDFADACRASGIPVRVGHWRIPGRPRCILVEFSSLISRKDELLGKLWDDHKVDSIEGGWDYVEPVLFGIAAAKVVAEWHDRYLAPFHRRTIVQAHTWMTASTLLTLKSTHPSIASVFTTHETVLGRALAASGATLDPHLAPDAIAALARTHGVTAKHSIEAVAARQADVYTTVSEVTADEAEVLLGRHPDPVVPNGIDLGVIDDLAGTPESRAETRATLERVARRFLGMPELGNAALLVSAGRYEFHNKGTDLLLEALAELDRRPGRPVVQFLLAPAGNSGIRREVRDRLAADDPKSPQDAIGITTHHLFDEDSDPIHERCLALGLDNRGGSRVKIIHIPVYVGPKDGLIGREYEAVLAAMDLSLFPSSYEPWGYTPQESVAVGVPTITSDAAGFGRWAEANGIDADSGVVVLQRVGVDDATAAHRLADEIERFLEEPVEARQSRRERCRETATRTAWTDLFEYYETAYERSLVGAATRSARAPARPAAPRPKPPVRIEPAKGRAPRLNYFDVAATLPEPLRPLERLSRNLWWCWDPEAPALFEEISPQGWTSCHHNPVRFLRRAYPEDLAAKAADRDYIARLQRVVARFDDYLAATRDAVPVDVEGAGAASFSAKHPVAYFCAEYGIHESLPIYSGGLGVLAGDHLKSASDLDLPLVGIGLFYRMGYMGQALTADGQQVAEDRENVPADLPMEPVTRADGSPVVVQVPLPGRDLTLRAWRVAVGRVTLYLLDANTPENREEDRAITRNLYGGDHEMRIRQLIALGRGGVRLLGELGIAPSVYHMNEGHAAFLSLERVARLIRLEGSRFDAAREWVRATTAFTTHTPVPAGHDRFPEDLMRRYFSDVPDWVGVPWERFLGFGRAVDSDHEFNMTYLALSFSSFANGVSQLHGTASKELLHPYWPSLLEEEVPVHAITNGVHLPTWTHPKIAALLGARSRTVTRDDFRTAAKDVDPAELWEARQETKRVLRRKVEERVRKAFLARNDSPSLLNSMLEGLDTDALWIGFARRFAPYKRAGLLFRDIERLRAICDDPDRPVRILVAGKAHPRDGLGQDVLRGIVQHTRGPSLAGRVLFVEDYDMDLARALVQGVDVWLNNPTRMQEASGTSGMKVAANGGLNLSIADGWWPEAADGYNGWTIADTQKIYSNQALQDEYDAAVLYRMLEEDVVPLFYERDETGLPAAWLTRVIHTLHTVPPFFSTDRMVQQYLDKAYRPLARAWFTMRADRARANLVAERATRLRKSFADLRVVDMRLADLGQVAVGDSVDAWVQVDLGGLAPDEIVVELVFGNAPQNGSLRNMVAVVLEPTGEVEGTLHAFQGSHRIERSGRYAQGLRLRPRTLSVSPSALRDLVLWA
ncbi:MAG: alpha-glucan family phosphorylase [Planctomycetes bacterium]|nr:alpha-glucan family phosphorylase [Planctomycetota bacterium]